MNVTLSYGLKNLRFLGGGRNFTPLVCRSFHVSHRSCYAELFHRRLAVKSSAAIRCMSGEVSKSVTVSGDELDKFKQYSSDWWKLEGEYAALRSLNKLRVPLIRDLLINHSDHSYPGKPLVNQQILDVGCGGGILSEPLARLGANVTAIDPLPENIDSARAHSSCNEDLVNLQYQCTTVEELNSSSSTKFDLVVASEVIEHVENPSIFMKNCCSLVKPSGHLVITTINRNILSTLLVKYAAEYLLRIVPENTHDENKFITPNELTDMLRENGMSGINFRGMALNPLTNTWTWTESYPMNYACYAMKV